MTLKSFPSCGAMPLGIYPLVDRAAKLRPLFENGITTAQLRIKDLVGAALRDEVRQAVALARIYHARLFINDAWREAIACQAYGVHLGQEDCEALEESDWRTLRASGLRLGISTHTQNEMTFALSVKPSYMAIGPVFETQSKHLEYETTGLSRLTEWVSGLGDQGEKIPVVAIGGIDVTNITQVVKAGVQGVAMIGGVQVSNTDSSIDIDKVRPLKELFQAAWEERK
jgi:thiamine-phosphate pyrophosphorylase/hydroxymethylpyrimidine kinase/phosphomethylpyrimidine kinase/thiamine-phosphate diphosphorylase